MDKKEINKYKFIFNENGYIISGGKVLEKQPYDWEGQMADYPNITRGWTKFVNGQLVEDEDKKAEILDREAKENEIAELKQMLADTDYIWNVIKEGDHDESYYADVIANRHIWRLRVRELEEELGL